MFTKTGDAQPIELIKADDLNDQETKNKLDTLKDNIAVQAETQELADSKEGINNVS